jgi:hypothetical protein
MADSDEATRKRIEERYDFFERLKPQAFIQGLGGFRRYFGAKFADDLVAFENMSYGNAVYVMFSDWQKQSRKTRTELLGSGRQGADFVRVIHGSGWKNAVTRVIKAAQQKKRT